MDETERPEPPDLEETPEGINVYFWHSRYSPGDVLAELPDGSRLSAIWQLEGRRLGFERPLPPGTWILLQGKRTWGPIDRK